MLAALIGAAAAQPAAIARAAAADPVAKLALALLPSPSFTIQSVSAGGIPRSASDEKLRAYCKLLHTRTPGVCYAATEEGTFARQAGAGIWMAWLPAFARAACGTSCLTPAAPLTLHH